ncbi:MAG: dTMP kinase [Eggerthellaceae bacterium]|nr:dTMP kinase [Eggerthellaceae bacterium]
MTFGTTQDQDNAAAANAANAAGAACAETNTTGAACAETNASRGIFITFEGGEGAGKSTHINFLAEVLEEHGYEVLRLREPGGTVIGEKLREIVLDAAHQEMSHEAELLIYEAARAQIVAEVIKPALERGAVVLCDRFFDSTLAYQVYGRGLDATFVKQVNDFAVQGAIPQRTIVLSCGRAARCGLERATKHGVTDRLESAGEDFHTRVNEAFLELAKDYPERIRVVESQDLKSQTACAVFAALKDLFTWISPLLDDKDFFARVDTGRYGNKHCDEG